MFFDLKPLPDSTDNVRPIEFYTKNSEVTLSIQAPMVLLCDSVSRPWLERERARLAPAMHTLYVEKALTDYDIYATTHPIITKQRAGNPHYNGSRNTPSYFILSVMKLYAIKLAAQLMPEASHYFWVDIGCAHVVDNHGAYLPGMLSSPNPKVSCVYIHYRSHAELSNMQQFLGRGGLCAIAAGIMSVQKEYVDVFFTRFLSVYYEMLSIGLGHAEEQILAYLFDRFPDMFHLYYGDYYSCASNYRFVVRDYSAIKRFYLSNTLAAGRKDLAKLCAQNVLASVSNRTLGLPAEEIAYLEGIVRE
jgi:hypothetical protein